MFSCTPLAAPCAPARGLRAACRSRSRRAAAASAPRVAAQAGAGNTSGPLPPGLNKFSARITQPKSQGASQAMLYATGLKEEDMSKPQARRASRACRTAQAHFLHACMRQLRVRAGAAARQLPALAAAWRAAWRATRARVRIGRRVAPLAPRLQRVPHRRTLLVAR
jgi:hypothetical protein